MATIAHRKSHASKDGMGHMADGVMHRLTDQASDMAEQASDIAGQASDMAGKKIKQMRKSIRGSIRSAGRGINQMEKSFEQTVAARPLISMGTALAAGMGIVFGMWALDCFMRRDR
jgi:ElaB/YqjD/DUF883 family membrane-anchored ribosome-binding protein